MAAASSSSSYVHQIKHDLFTSFWAADVRRGFLSHLTKELRRKDIDAYVDYRLERGQEILSALSKEIEASIISLVIFSKDYASSKWCLEELVKIMERKKVNGQIVMPVFYNVDPSHVKHQDGTYKNAFVKLEEEFMDDIDKLQNFRFALNSAANLTGYLSMNFEWNDGASREPSSTKRF